MMRVIRFVPIAAIAGLIMLAMGPAQAATDTQSQTITATVSATATLVLGSTTVTFPSANPSTTPSIVQSETGASLDVTANARTSDTGTVTLTVLAGGDLTSSSDTIPISNITWAHTGTGYVDGTLNKTTAQSVGSWTGSGVYSGTVTYSLANSWNYATGTYTATITYTLTAP